MRSCYDETCNPYNFPTIKYSWPLLIVSEKPTSLWKLNIDHYTMKIGWKIRWTLPEKHVKLSFILFTKYSWPIVYSIWKKKRLNTDHWSIKWGQGKINRHVYPVIILYTICRCLLAYNNWKCMWYGVFKAVIELRKWD